MHQRFISEEQARDTLRRAVEEGRITLTPEQEAALLNPDGTWRETDARGSKALTFLRRLFRPRVGHF